MRRDSFEVYRDIDQKSISLGFEVRWAGRVSVSDNFELKRYHKRCLMIYLTGGKCRMFAEDGEWELGPGDLMVYPPNSFQHYQAMPGSTLKYYGLAISGTMLESILEGMPVMSAQVHHIGNQNQLGYMFHELVSQMLVLPPERVEIIWGLVLSILGEINVSIVQLQRKDSDNYVQTSRLDKAAQHIQLHYNAELKVKDLAEMTGYSVSWFENQFSRKYKMSPLTFQAKQRIARAKDMIRADIFSISEIGYAVGFNDPLYFSRVFKKNVGVSPQQYRNMVLKIKKEEN